MGSLLKIAAFALAAGVGVQMMVIDYDPPPDQGRMFVGGEAGEVFEAACADCHTHDTTWPWYARVPPVSFFVARHVEEGREHFNLSTWDSWTRPERAELLEEVVEVLEEGEMPPVSYVRMHPEAQLTDAQRQALIDWAKSLRSRMPGG